MARACKIYVVVVNGRPISAYTVKKECRKFLDKHYPVVTTNLRVLSLADGDWYGGPQIPKDITAHMYGLEEKD